MLFTNSNNQTKTTSDKYERIIQAAILVFAEKGFHHAKVADVAKAAEVADGTIYLYFKNKDDILITVFEHSMDFFLKQAREKLSTLSGTRERIKGFIQLHLQSVETNPALAQVLQVELRSSSKFMKGYKTTKFFDYLKCLEEIIEEGQKKGELLESQSAGLLARAFFGAIDEIALEWVLMKKKKYSIEQATQGLLELFLFGIKKQNEFENLKGNS